jgi:AcrR family transcriptional regulator
MMLLKHLAIEKYSETTEKGILDSARRVFTRKGYAAARMDEIAKEAGINRALLHYYFRSKERMFEKIFIERISQFFGGLVAILNSEAPLTEKIRRIIDHDISTFQEHPELPLFIMQELSLNPERLPKFMQGAGVNPKVVIDAFGAQVKKASRNGDMRATDGTQLLINIMSMCVYPFIARPMLRPALGLDEEGFRKMMERRKTEVAAFVMQSIKP